MSNPDPNYASFEDWLTGCHGEIRVRPQNMGGGWQALGYVLESDRWESLWDDIDFSRTCIDAIKEAEANEDCVISNHQESADIAFEKCIQGLQEMHVRSIEGLKASHSDKPHHSRRG